MQDFDEIKPIQDMFETFEAQAPKFDSLFEGEVLGNAPLRQIVQSKLMDLEVTAPSYDQLFTKQAYLIPAPRKRMIPLWIGIGAAAACFILLLLLPQKTLMDEVTLSQIEQKVFHKSSLKAKSLPLIIPTNTITTQALESPKVIQTLAVVNKDSKVPGSLSSYEETDMERDTLNDNLTKIKPAFKSNLAVTYERSIEEAYAAAKTKKAKVKRERMTLGTNLNSTNRLLSLVNTKSAENYPLQGIASNYSSGYSSLAGASSKFVGNENSPTNIWATPENLDVSLEGYKAVYSLPISFGLSFSLPVFSNLEFMTGLNYTYLSGTISGQEANYSFDLKQELHYLGIPLKIAVKFIKLGHFGAYAAVGGTLEKGLAGVQKSQVDYTNGTSDEWNHSQQVDGFQTSFTGQIGITYELNKTFNIYFEPGVSYFQPSDQPISSRTEEPFNFNLGLGLRYRIH